MAYISSVSAVVLAAGKGTRMKSEQPKVLHKVLGRPMLHRVLDIIKDIVTGSLVVVTGHKGDKVADALSTYSCHVVTQEQQLGTGHAVQCAESLLGGEKSHVLILCGDAPLIRRGTLINFIENHIAEKRDLSVLTTVLDEPSGYGRIVRASDSGHVAEIVEEKDADEEVKKIGEINTGIYLVSSDILFNMLNKVKADNAQGEYYLTDIVSVARSHGKCVFADPIATPDESMGINSRSELAAVEGILLKELRNSLMDKGVTLHQPETVYVEPEVTVEPDVTIYPHNVIAGHSFIGKGASIGPFSYIDNYRIEPGTVVPAMSVLR